MVWASVRSAWITGEGPFTGKAASVQLPGCHVGSLGTLLRSGAHSGDLELPPGPHRPLGLVSLHSSEQCSEHAEYLGSLVTEILLRAGPAILVLDDQLVSTKPAKNRRSVPGRYAKQVRRPFDTERAMFPEQRVKLSGEVTEAFPREQVVTLINDLLLDFSEENGSLIEKIGRAGTCSYGFNRVGGGDLNMM